MTYRWTPEQKVEFTRLWNAGETVADIQRHFGISQQTMDGLRGRLGLPSRHGPGWSDADIDTLTQRWAKGDSASQIARDLPGRTRNSVIGKLHRLGLTDLGRGKAAKPGRATHARVIKRKKSKPAPVPGISALLSWTSPKSTPEDQAVFAQEGHTAHARVAAGVGVESPNAVPLLDYRSGCKWPLGERGAVSYCCNPVLGGEGSGKVYCVGHAKISVAAAQPLGLRPRDASRLTRFDRVERDGPRPASVERTLWDDAREAA